jgi:hypothetical protein
VKFKAKLGDVRNGPGTGLKTPLLGYKGECCATPEERRQPSLNYFEELLMVKQPWLN